MTYTYDLQIRFRDIDALAHVNNAVYVTYLEQARYAFFHEKLDVAGSQVTASLEIDYLEQITLGSDATVHLEIEEIGTTSITIAYEITQDGAIKASARTVQVLIDENGEPRAVEDELRSALEAY